MLRVRPEDARPGMVLALPVMHPTNPGTALLCADAELTSTHVSRLQSFGLREIYVRHPQLDWLITSVEPRVIRRQLALAGRLSPAFELAATDPSANLDLRDVVRSVSQLLDSVLSNTRALALTHELADAERPMLARSCNTCLLTMVMGLRAEAYIAQRRSRVEPRRTRQMESLALAGLLYDIGLLYLPGEAMEYYERTLDDADVVWRSHVDEGYARVRGQIPPTAAAAILHHHQRLDGSGFPNCPRMHGDSKPLKGDRVHVFARFVAVADEYTRRREPIGADRFGHRRKQAVEALRDVVELGRNGKLDRTAVAALVNCVCPYPIGGRVTLSTGDEAVVVGWNASSPCRPRVVLSRLVDDPSCPVISEDSVLDLSKIDKVEVAVSDGEETAGFAFSPMFDGEFDLTHGMLPAQFDTSAMYPWLGVGEAGGKFGDSGNGGPTDHQRVA